MPSVEAPRLMIDLEVRDFGSYAEPLMWAADVDVSASSVLKSQDALAETRVSQTIDSWNDAPETINANHARPHRHRKLGRFSAGVHVGAPSSI